MTADKIKELFEKSQEIKNMMKKLGIMEYHGYSILDTAVGSFLILEEIPITRSLSDTYLGNDLSKFMPSTTIEITENLRTIFKINYF